MSILYQEITTIGLVIFLLMKLGLLCTQRFLELNSKAKKFGKMSVNAIPWAQVYWRKKLLGSTPIENLSMPVGRHSLLVVNKKLKIKKKIYVVIKPGKSTIKLVKLKEF